MNTAVSNSRRVHECEVCHKQFSKVSNSKRHQKTAHPIYFNLRQQKTVHGSNTSLNLQESSVSTIPVITNETEHKCAECNRCFAQAENLQRHMESTHHIQPHTKARYKCSECLSWFSTNCTFREHISYQHPEIIIRTENLSFKSHEEFDQWKLEIEKETVSFFCLKRKYKTSVSSVCYYPCHRSGFFRSTSKGKRHIKISGSCRIDSYCPASIYSEVLKNSNGEFQMNVKFCSTHMGHACEVERLRLSKPEKRKIAELLEVGVPICKILSNISKTASPMERLGITKAQDIRNISASYGIKVKTIRSKKNAESVNNFMKEMMDKEDNPILMYNSPGKSVPEYEYEDNIFQINSSDDHINEKTDIAKEQEELCSTFLNLIPLIKKCTDMNLLKETHHIMATLKQKLETALSEGSSC